MDNSKVITSLLPAATLVAATLASWYFRPPELRSDRPAGGGSALVDPSGMQTLESRLWQDPFEPMRELRNSGDASKDKASARAPLKDEWSPGLARIRREL